jgi:predicted dehydrogenase
MIRRGALIGCGFFARNHMLAWRDLPGVEIVAVCDTDPAKAAAFAAEFGATAHTDAAAMLAEVRPDFVDIATTVRSHRALVELAARHSGGVICQKPFAETLADGRAMVAACEAAGIPLLVHENFRWQAPIRRMAALVDGGAIGRPHFLRLSFRYAFDIYANQPYLAEIDDLALSDVGLHLFDMARRLFGDVTHVACGTQRLNPKVRGQDAFLAQLHHAGGAMSSVECSFFSHYAPDRFVQTLAVAEGDGGSIELLEGYRLRLHRAGAVSEEETEPPVPAWGERPWNLVQDSVIAFQAHVLEVLAGRAAPQPSGADNLRTLALTRAAIRSSQAGGRQIEMAGFRDETEPA